MALSVVKTWIAGEVLYAADLNAEFANVYNNGEDLATPATKAHDMDGFEVTLDGDGDTGIVSDTDDRIDFRVSGTDLFRFDGTVTTPVNGFDFVASDTGNSVSIDAVGSDTNIAIDIDAKGTGTINLNGDSYGALGSRVFSF